MNQFHITGKVIHISNTDRQAQGITITHFPDNAFDGYFDMGLVFSKELWSRLDIRQYDFIEVKGHYITLNKNTNPKKLKLLHVVDEVIEVIHE